MDDLTYDPTGTYIDGTGLAPDALAGVAPRLEAARGDVIADLELYNSGGEVPAAKRPLDAAFFDLPERLLAAHRAEGPASELGRILATGERVASAADHLVVLGIGGSYMGLRALFEACCAPYHNELPRAERGGRPRLYFEGDNLDAHAMESLVALLRAASRQSSVEGRWALVPISKSGGTLETAVALEVFLAELRAATGGDADLLRQLFVPVTGPSGKLREIATEGVGAPEIFPVPDGVGGRFSILSAVGLVPAAILGLDVVRLLEGAARMNEIFRTAPTGQNPVLDFVGIGHLLEAERGATTRILSFWGKGLEAVGLWYDQLLSESLGKEERGATPITVVNTRDLHSRGQQHQEGRRDKLITNVVVREPRAGATIAVPGPDHPYAGTPIHDILLAAVQGTNRAYADDRRPTADLHLPRVDEYTLGQLFQMLMLATAVEGRLIGINPYGQPGVEAYKTNLKAILAKR